MNVMTQDGLLTDLSWWAQMMVDGDSIVLSNVRTVRNKGEDPTSEEELADSKTLVVAEFPKNQEIVQQLFKDLNEGIRYGKDSFDVNDWFEERSA